MKKLLAVLASVALVAIGAPAHATTVAAPSTVSAVASQIMPKVHLPGDASASEKIDDYAYGFGAAGNEVIAVGSFNHYQQMGQGVNPASNVLEFDILSGRVIATPTVSGEVWSAVILGGSLYVCGDTGVYKFDSPDYANPDPTFNGTALSGCSTIMADNGHIYVGGRFKNGHYLEAVYASTGAVSTYFDSIKLAGQVHGFGTRVYRMSASPDKVHAVIIGDFTTANGVAHSEAIQVSLGATSATLNPWHNAWFEKVCSGDIGNDFRDAKYSPDGTKIALTATGGPHYHTFCDSVIELPSTPTNTTLTPIFQVFFDGDTGHSVAYSLDGQTVYIGGHMRYFSHLGPQYGAPHIPYGQPCDPRNPYEGNSTPDTPRYYGYDCPNPGDFYRPGLGAVQASNGSVFAWNPERTRNEGAKALMVIDAGLFVGSDGDLGGCQAPVSDSCDGQTLTNVGGNLFLPNKK